MSFAWGDAYLKEAFITPTLNRWSDCGVRKTPALASGALRQLKEALFKELFLTVRWRLCDSFVAVLQLGYRRGTASESVHTFALPSSYSVFMQQLS